MLTSSKLLSQLALYDESKAYKFIEQQLTRKSNWEMFSNENGHSHFASKKEFKQKHKLVVIPVYDLIGNKDLATPFVPNYSFYTSFVLKDSSYLGTGNAFDISLIDGKRSKLFAVGYYSPKLFQLIRDLNGEFFYDNTNELYRVLSDGKLYHWDYDSEVFVLDSIRMKR